MGKARELLYPRCEWALSDNHRALGTLSLELTIMQMRTNVMVPHKSNFQDGFVLHLTR